jgi:hypothetical protein
VRMALLEQWIGLEQLTSATDGNGSSGG